MQITIDVDEPYLKVLRKWASVSRTFDVAIQACEELSEDERYLHCMHELEVLRPVLDYLHKIVQQQIWQQ